MLNRAQLRLAFGGLGVLLAQGLFPPWELRFSGPNAPFQSWPEGPAFLLKPPNPNVNAFQYHASIHIQIAWATLLAYWATTVLMTFALCWLFVRGRAEESDCLFEMLRVRKLIFALVLGLGFPLPYIGCPAVFLLAALFKEGIGFEGAALLKVILASTLLYSGVFFLFLAGLGRAKSERAMKVLVASMAIALFAASFVIPSVNNYLEHARDARAQPTLPE